MRLARMTHTIFEAPREHEKNTKSIARRTKPHVSWPSFGLPPPHPKQLFFYNQQTQTNQTRMANNENNSDNKTGAGNAQTDDAVVHRAIRAATTYPKTIMLDPTDEPIETCTYVCEADDDGENEQCDFSQCRKTVRGSVALWLAGIKPVVSRVLTDLDRHQNNHMVSLFDGVDIVTPYGTVLLMHRASTRPPCGRIASINLWSLLDE
nr:hypothetical protein [Pandoravirus aubagnensis]